MARRANAFTPDHPIVITFLILALIAFMSFAAEVLKPVALAVLLSFALAPLCRFLERRRLPRSVAVVLTVVAALGAVAAIGFVVGRELEVLAKDLPTYERRIQDKVTRITSSGKSSTLDRISKAGSELASTLDKSLVAQEREIQPVRIVSQPTLRERIVTGVGPFLEFLGMTALILILVLFLLTNREDMTDRLIQLFGHGRISLTTKTMEEVGHRISRYLATLVTVNTCVGLIVGSGLWLIGIPLAALWGFLAAVLRFIPYVGPATAFALPMIFSIATGNDWTRPIEVLVLFAVLEGLANSFLEPVIYGRTTGVSALGLLVAALFWTWLWGAEGLLLSTPLTVCLAVLGKYVPALSPFATFLGEESALEQDLRFYQRLLALDQDGATEIVEAALKQRPRAEVFDEILIPTLSRTERDRAREEIDEREQAFIQRVIEDLLDDLEGTPDLGLAALAPASDAATRPDNGVPGTPNPPAPDLRILSLATDKADALALRMLGQLVEPLGARLEILDEPASPLEVGDLLARSEPTLIVLSYLPPYGLTPARYLVRRLRARLPRLPILVGRWGEGGSAAAAAERLEASGASKVVFTLADARDQIQASIVPKPEAPAPATEVGVGHS